MPELTVKENLDNARAKAHITLKKNGHYKRMAILSAKARKKRSKGRGGEKSLSRPA